MPKGVGRVHLSNVRYRKMALDITIEGTGATVKQCRVNGKETKDRFLPVDTDGRKVVAITVGDS